MGATPDRITAAEFVTPPELASWSLAANGAGRIGGVRLELLADPAGTRLGSCYQQVPLRVLPAFQFGHDRPSLVYLLNPTAGLMDGDGQLVEVAAEAGSRAVIVGQSATRIHPSLHGFSTQQWRVRVEAGAVLFILPGPAIPFRGCRYFQRVRVDLAEGASLIWGDLWFAGRYARGEASEQFQFEWMIQDMAVRRAGGLIFRDRFGWRGPWNETTARWHFGGSPAGGSLFATGPLAPEQAAGGACFTTAAGDSCVRWCGESEQVSARLVETALASAAERAGSKGLPADALAPNHWFRKMG
jgi:urease accessory protein